MSGDSGHGGRDGQCHVTSQYPPHAPVLSRAWSRGFPPRHRAVPAAFQLFPCGISSFPLALLPQHPRGFVSTTRFKCLISL